MRSTVLAVLAGIAMLPTGADAAMEFPRLIAPSARQECQEALKIAQTVFLSDAPYLYASSPVPPEVKSHLVLHADGVDISGGDALLADLSVFDKRADPTPQASRSFYWQRSTQGSYRLVLKELNRGWRGDTYSVFAVPEDMPLEYLAGRLPDVAPKDRATIPAVADSWRPPLIFNRDGSNQLWFIDVGQPYEVLGKWTVQAADPQGIQPLCSIQFASEMPRGPIALLPTQVQTFERLLDRALGPGFDEGTEQPTAAIRLDVQHIWANVALRPWAASHPYNSHAEIDEGLKKWAIGSATNSELLRQLQLAYLPAERSLAAYYRAIFQMSASAAIEQAVYEIDIAYRTHFGFQEDRADLDDSARTANPWRWK